MDPANLPLTLLASRLEGRRPAALVRGTRTLQSTPWPGREMPVSQPPSGSASWTS